MSCTSQYPALTQQLVGRTVFTSINYIQLLRGFYGIKERTIRRKLVIAYLTQL